MFKLPRLLILKDFFGKFGSSITFQNIIQYITTERKLSMQVSIENLFPA